MAVNCEVLQKAKLWPDGCKHAGVLSLPALNRNVFFSRKAFAKSDVQMTELLFRSPLLSVRCSCVGTNEWTVFREFSRIISVLVQTSFLVAVKLHRAAEGTATSLQRLAFPVSANTRTLSFNIINMKLLVRIALCNLQTRLQSIWNRYYAWMLHFLKFHFVSGLNNIFCDGNYPSNMPMNIRWDPYGS